MKENKNLCIIQARMGATRLPGKILLKVDSISLLEYEIKRVQQAQNVHQIVIATSNQKQDDQVEEFCKEINIPCFRGSENDVLDRYYQCSLKYPEYNNIIRITGDCPLIDPQVIDEVIDLFSKTKSDYASNVLKETYPDGMDIEIFSKKALIESAKEANLKSEREHVTLYIRNNERFKKVNLEAPQNSGNFRLTVDNQEDYEVIKFLIQNSKITDEYEKYIELLIKNPQIMKLNMDIQRNEGLIKSLKNDKQIK